MTLALVSLSLSFDDFGQQPFLAAVFLGHFLHLLLERGELGLQLLDGILFVRKVAGDDERGRDEFGLVFLLAEHEVGLGLCLLVLVLDDEPRLGGLAPAVVGDEVAIVLHGLGPVVHQVLIDVVGIEQRRGSKGGEQILGDGLDQRLGMTVLGEAFERGVLAFFHLAKSLVTESLNAVNSAWPKMAGFTSAMGSFSWQ